MYCEKHDEVKIPVGKSGKLRCRSCNREHQKTWYEKNKEIHRQRVRISNKKSLLEIKEKLWKLKQQTGCIDCGERNPVVLDFDHLDQQLKTNNISDLVRSRRNWDNILTEIAKCELRCANCHRIRTATQMGWYQGPD